MAGTSEVRSGPPVPFFEPPVDRADEDRQVAELLKRAHGHGGTEYGVGAPFSAYASLAASRGVSLETVVRSAIRNELADVVGLPAIRRGGRHRSDRKVDPQARVAGLDRRKSAPEN
jgi:hypothetical protein